MTHEQAADAVGRSRSATTNLLRLLKLPKPVQAMVMDGAIEAGAGFVKTSTGVYGRGATVDDVRLLARIVAMRVVDLLELVDVAEGDANGIPVPCGNRDFGFERGLVV